MTVLKKRTGTLVTLTLCSLGLGACAVNGDNTGNGMFPMWTLYTTALTDKLTHGPDAAVPAQYAATPPCIHPGDMPKETPMNLPVCTRKAAAHVAFWAARLDRYKQACRATTPSYCAEETGMVPHCHGFGKWRFCHSHPGGGTAHDHIHDKEFASNAREG